MRNRQIDELPTALLTGAKVPSDGDRLVSSQRAREQADEVALVMVKVSRAAHESSPPRMADDKTLIPRAIRAFTVPRGTSSCSAISRWLRPPK